MPVCHAESFATRQAARTMKFSPERVDFYERMWYDYENQAKQTRVKGGRLLNTRLAGAADKLRLYWKSPMPGRHMTYREIASFSFGGMGVKLITLCVGQMLVGVGNTLIGNTIGIAPGPMYTLSLISMLAGFPLTALRARMIDNTKSMKGKYRPYVFSMAVPTGILGLAFIFTPYEKMSSQLTKYLLILLYNIGFQFFFNFLDDAYKSLLNVLSPNTVERSDVHSIRSVIENFTPSLANIFLPMIARAITGQNTLYDLKIYRVFYPPLLAAGVLLTILVHVNTEEKIVQSKTRAVPVRFVDSFRAVMRNKYFWILSLGSWLGFLETAFYNILSWLYNYQGACTAGQYALISAINGNASLYPYIITPILVRTIGKRNILLLSNLLNIAFIALMRPVVQRAGSPNVIWLMLVCVFVNGMTTGIGNNIAPALNADVRDYQQYVSGERIDGMFSAVGLIGSVIGAVTGVVLPAIQERAGLNRAAALSLGYDGSNVYDVLHDKAYFVRICGMLVTASVVGAILNVLPYFFYDLTETKQRAMISVLKIRTFFEDHPALPADAGDRPEALALIDEAMAFAGETKRAIPKKGMAKQDRKRCLAENEKIEMAAYILAELRRFESEEGRAELETARKIAAAGLSGFSCADFGIAFNRDIALARKTIRKHYPAGIEAFDSAVFEELYAAADETALAIDACHQSLLRAKNAKDPRAQKQARAALADLRIKKAKIERELKEAAKQNAIYNEAARPYVKANRLLLLEKGYRLYADTAIMAKS